MKRPARLKILGKMYTVAYEPVGTTLAEDEYGECDLDNQKIVVRDGQPLDSEHDALLHEVCHAVDGAMVEEKEMAPEAVIRRIATGLLAVIRDNPGFITYLRTRTR